VKSLAQSLPEVRETRPHRALETVKATPPENDVIIATVGGFDLAYHGERFGKDGYRYETLLQRTGGDYEIDLPVTTPPIGAISRLEHALGGFEQERENYRNRLADAERRPA